MGWVFVFIAAMNELIGVWGLNLFSKNRTVKNGIIYIGGLAASFAFIYASFEYLPASVAYAVWTGIGTAGTVTMNMIFFGERKSLPRIASLFAIVIGVTGLKVLS